VKQSGLPLTRLSGVVQHLQRYEVKLNAAANNEVSISGLCEQGYNFLCETLCFLVDFMLGLCLFFSNSYYKNSLSN